MSNNTEGQVIQKLEAIKVSGDKGTIYNYEAGVILNLLESCKKTKEDLEENTNLMDYIGKEVYVIDCRNFTYFARKAYITGIEWHCENDLRFITNIKNHIFNEFVTIPEHELEKFKSFEEASKKAKELNEMPDNKKRTEQWLRNMQSILEMQYKLEEECNVSITNKKRMV